VKLHGTFNMIVKSISLFGRELFRVERNRAGQFSYSFLDGSTYVDNGKYLDMYLTNPVLSTIVNFGAQYYSQMQMNMWLCGAESGVFISYDDRYYKEEHHLHTVNVPRDEAHIELIKSKLLKATEYKQQIIDKINGAS